MLHGQEWRKSRARRLLEVHGFGMISASCPGCKYETMNMNMKKCPKCGKKMAETIGGVMGARGGGLHMGMAQGVT